MTPSRSKPPSILIGITRPDALALIGAAYVMTSKAYVLIEGSKASPSVRLSPKSGTKDLKEEFLLEYENQRHRWAIAKGSMESRRRIVGRMMGLAERLTGTEKRVSSELDEGQKAEIARLLDEANSEPWDPNGVARPWRDPKAGKGT